jgi:hypothetical protein
MTMFDRTIWASLAFAGGLSLAFTASCSAQAPASERLAAEMTQLGIKRCAPIIQHVAQFLMEGGEAGFQIKLLGTPADETSVIVTIESSHADLGTTRYATIMVAPKESCSGYYEQSIYWTSGCTTLKQSNFANFPDTTPLFRYVQTSAASPTVLLYLMPAGEGCVSVKKEIFH